MTPSAWSAPVGDCGYERVSQGVALRQRHGDPLRRSERGMSVSDRRVRVVYRFAPRMDDSISGGVGYDEDVAARIGERDRRIGCGGGGRMEVQNHGEYLTV